MPELSLDRDANCTVVQISPSLRQLGSHGTLYSYKGFPQALSTLSSDDNNWKTVNQYLLEIVLLLLAVLQVLEWAVFSSST